MDMIRCSNCAQEFNLASKDAIDVTVGAVGHLETAAALCPGCTEGVNVLKIVLRRRPDGVFEYEQYSALEMQERAFGKDGNLERLG